MPAPKPFFTLEQQKDFSQFMRNLRKIINQFTCQTAHIAEIELLTKMGFPLNWKKITVLSK